MCWDRCKVWECARMGPTCQWAISSILSHLHWLTAASCSDSSQVAGASAEDEMQLVHNTCNLTTTRGDLTPLHGDFWWISLFTLWLFNIAIFYGPFIDDCPIKTSIYKGFSMAMLNNQMVHPCTPHDFEWNVVLLTAVAPAPRRKMLNDAGWAGGPWWSYFIWICTIPNKQKVKVYRMPCKSKQLQYVTVHMLLRWCHLLGLVMTCIDPRAVQSWQMCVTNPRNMVEDEFVWK
jgi:hypothetical protein